MRTGLSAVGWVGLVLVLVVGIAAASFGIRWVMAGPSGKLEAREQILSGNSRIEAYNRFFNQCASVQALEAAIDESEAQLKTAVSVADQERIRTNLNAQRTARARAIFQYNADSTKNYTSGQFRDLDLPFQLDPAPYTGVNKTTCAA